MSKQLRLNFLFNSFDKLFISGTVVNGTLKIYTINGVQVNKIKIGVVGKIRIEADDSNKLTAAENTFYSSEVKVFSASDLTTNEVDDEQLLEFAIPLSDNLPPSIVLREGSVMYQLYATMEEVFPDGTTQSLNTSAAISVVRQVACKDIPNHDKQKLSKRAHVHSCFCFKTQEFNSSLLVTPRVYVPGDCIKINAVVYNTSPAPVLYVQAALIQKVKFKFEDRSVKGQRVVSETKRESIMPLESQVWDKEVLRIPPVACTTTHKNLSVSYKLKLILVRQDGEVDFSKAHLKVRVVICNIPLDSALANFNPLPACEYSKNASLPIPKQYQDYARVENCIERVEGVHFVPAYITYSTDQAMETVELQ